MKTITAILIATLCTMLTACKDEANYFTLQQQLVALQIEQMKQNNELAKERERTNAARANAVTAMKDKLDAGGAAIGMLMALAPDTMFGGSNGATKQPQVDVAKMMQAVQPPKSLSQEIREWAVIALGGYKIFVDKEVGLKSIEANRDTQLGLYNAFTAIQQASTGAVVEGVRVIAGQGPTNQYQITVQNSQGVGVGGNGSYTGQLVLTCETTGQGAAAPGGNGTATGTTGTTNGTGGAAAAAAASGANNCTLTRTGG